MSDRTPRETHAAPGSPQSAPPGRDPKQLTTSAHIIYGLYAASLIVGITALVGVIFCYAKRADAAGTWLESHIQWMIRTFWISLLIAIVAVLTIWILGLGALIGLAGMVWFIFRIVKGWMKANEGLAIEDPTAFI